MRRTEATAWAISACAVAVRWSQAKTSSGVLAAAAAATGVRRATLANLGRQMFGAAERQIERAWRFTGKGKRNGWAPRDAQVARPERFDRHPLVPAVARLLACGVGPIAGSTHSPAEWRATTRPAGRSVYATGLVVLERINASPQQALAAAAVASSELVAPNWG